MPPTKLERYANAIESLIDKIGNAVSWLVLAVVFLLFVQNPLREYVGRGQFFANDMGQLAHAAVFMVGVSYAWRSDRQVRVDLFYRRMSARGRALVNLLGTIFLLLPWLGFVVWDSLPTIVNSVRILEHFPESGSPGFFLMNSMLLAFSVTLTMQASAVLARSIVILCDPRRETIPVRESA